VTWFWGVLALFFAWPAMAADWRDGLTPYRPGSFPPPRSQKASYRFGWGAVSAADAEIEFSRGKKSQLQLKLTAKTTGPVRLLWQMDSVHTARCSATTLRPISLEQTERYRQETEKTKVDFTPEAAVRFQEVDPPDKTKPRPKRFEFPNLTDLQTALLFVRSQKLEPGASFSLVVFPARSAYLAKVDVLGREKLKVGGKEYPALKLKVGLQHLTKNWELEPHRKFKGATAWLSDDQDRLLLKIETEVFVGSVWMELQSVEFTGR
jgi:hypothetical protein